MTPDVRDDIRDWYPTWSCAAELMDDCRPWRGARQARTPREGSAFGEDAERHDPAGRDRVPGGLIRSDRHENEFGTWLGKPVWHPALLPMAPSLLSVAPQAWTHETAHETLRAASAAHRPPRRPGWLPRCWSRL